MWHKYANTLKRVFLSIIIVVAGLLPVLRLISIILTTGMDNLSNDYVWLMPTVLDAAKNGFPWGHLSSTCYRGECEPLTFIMMTLVARYFHWNSYIEILFSVLCTVVAVSIIYVLFAGFSLQPKRSWVFVFVSALGLSVTQLSAFTFGPTAMRSATCLLGLCLGLLGIKYFPKTLKGFLLIILGMWIAVWSDSTGLLTIPIFLFGMLLEFKRKRYFVLWAMCLLVMSIPYVQFYSGIRLDLSQAGVSIISFFRPVWEMTIVGYFLSNGTPFGSPAHEMIPTNPSAFGYLGIASLASAVTFIYVRSRFEMIRRHFTELALIAFSLGSIWQISLVRPVIAPWYIVNAMPFWVGLVGLFYSLLLEGTGWSTLAMTRRLFSVVQLISVLFFAIIAVLLLNSNIMYEDKAFLLPARAPVSAACLRNYKTAPTYCEGTLFQGGIGNLSWLGLLGAPLENNHMSVFAPHQIWSLQGEYAFSRVKVTTPPSIRESWWTGLDGEPLRWDDYKHLDLLLPSGSTLFWAVELPPNTQDAEFGTAIGINNRFAGIDSPSVSFRVSIQSLDQPEKVLFVNTISSGTHTWSPVQLSLGEYRGQRIEIRLSTSGGEGQAGEWAMFQFPTIELNESEINQPEPISAQLIPENTDLSNAIPSESDEDYVIDDKSNSLIGTNTFQLADSPTTWKLGKGSSLALEAPIHVCLSEYSDFVVTLSMTSEVSPRYLYLWFTLDGQRQVVVGTPILPDGDIHSYRYPLRLLGADPGSRLTNLTIFLSDTQLDNAKVQFIGIRLTGRNPSYACD